MEELLRYYYKLYSIFIDLLNVHGFARHSRFPTPHFHPVQMQQRENNQVKSHLN